VWFVSIFCLPRHDGLDFLGFEPSPVSASSLSRPEHEALLAALLGKVEALTKLVGGQHEEIARLKVLRGLRGRPIIKPNGIEKGTEPTSLPNHGKRRGRGKITPWVVTEVLVMSAAVPPGSRFQGYESFLVEDLVISAGARCYRRERWVTPDRRTILAPCRTGIDCHFGPESRGFVLMQCHQHQSTLSGCWCSRTRSVRRSRSGGCSVR
jgi:hypothetical protein